jgi:hypothetical protein
MRDDTEERVPPRQDNAGHRIALKQLWHHLPVANCRDALRTLGRVVILHHPIYISSYAYGFRPHDDGSEGPGAPTSIPTRTRRRTGRS